MPRRSPAAVSAESRYQKRVLAVGGLAAFVLFVVGAPIYNNRIEADLERRVPDALAAAGFDGVTATFSGQEGSLSCARVLTDPEAALRVAHEVTGVHAVRLDRACRVRVRAGDDEDAPDAADAVPGDASVGDTPTSVPAAATVAEALTSGRFAAFAALLDDADLGVDLGDPEAGPFIVLAPRDEAWGALPATVAGRLGTDPELRADVLAGHVVEAAWDADAPRDAALTTAAGHTLEFSVDGRALSVDGVALGEPVVTTNGVVYPAEAVLLTGELASAGAAVTATLADGILTLEGAVADQAAHDALIFAGTAAVGAERLTNALTIGDGSGLDTAGAAELAALIATLDGELVNGQASHDGERMHLSGRYPNDAAAVRANAAAAELGASIDIAPRPAATADDATALEHALNEFVRANPIQFEPNSAVLDPSALTIIDRVAARLVEYGGLQIEVGGHTDSDGQPANNQRLSEQRAGVVRQELISRGVDADAVTAVGYGSDRPVLVGGLEDKTASRRVEFQISAG